MKNIILLLVMVINGCCILSQAGDDQGNTSIINHIWNNKTLSNDQKIEKSKKSY